MNLPLALFFILMILLMNQSMSLNKKAISVLIQILLLFIGGLFYFYSFFGRFFSLEFASRFLGIITLFIFIFINHRRMKQIEKEKGEQERECNLIQQEFLTYSDKEEDVQASIQQLISSVEQTSSAYKATLAMSSTLDFNETLESYVKGLIQMEGFQKLHLILAESDSSEENGASSAVLRAYRCSVSNPVLESYPCSQAEEVVFSRMRHEKNIQTVSDPVQFGLVASSFDICSSMGAHVVPLYFQTDFLGVLVYFNDKRTAFENQLELLSLHFSMEIKKSRLYEKIKRLSTIDSLTSTYLKRHFLPLFEEEIKRHKGKKTIFSVVMMDVDHFKSINDQHGHLMGDHVIQEIGRILKSRCREEDLISRFGGDEFTLILPGASLTESLQIVERIKKAIAKLVFNPGTSTEFKVTISAGIAFFPESGEDRDKLLEAADQALYKAKREGGDRIQMTEG
ncbi:MAG: GGDEF domain-containing protein [Candidatus Aureabacteria bacterium]|nr:GGDEF domain-containing protein [Candidatus Auribacterota bacterium]